MTLSSIVMARNLGLEKKDRKQVWPSIEKFLLQTIEMHGLDLSNTINIAVEKYLQEKNYLTPETLETLGSCTIIEKQIFENGINATAEQLHNTQINTLLCRIKESVPQS